MSAGWPVRPLTREDWPAAAEVWRAQERAYLGAPVTTLARFARELDGSASFDAGLDQVGIDLDGRLVAAALIVKRESVVVVDPAMEGRGLGSALLAWVRARERAQGRTLSRQGNAGANAAAERLLTAAGYRFERFYATMRRDLASTGPVERAPLSDGYTLREVDPVADLPILHAISERAFARRPDHVPETAAEFERSTISHPEFSSALSTVAFAPGGAPAGLAIGWSGGEWEGGFVALLAVDPDHSRRGLGRALLLEGMARIGEAGFTVAELNVAGDNPRALALYTSAGMAEKHRWVMRVADLAPAPGDRQDRASATMPGVLEDIETRKDTIQVAVEGAFDHAGRIAGILTGAGRDITRELGDWATDLFEMRDAARRARVDRRRSGEDTGAEGLL